MIGSTLAHYRVTAKLGQGGMGEVYRATDTSLDREVAVKVVPESFASDKERSGRFEREAKALAQLNHPHIASVHDFGESDGKWYLAMELVEGEDLSVRLKRGPLPIEDALRVCQQIAEALEPAHEKGIIHRDLKPSNVKFADDDRVKVLDFGLAKVVDASETAPATVDLDSPTITANYTMPGTLLGTAAYMSPEQARGKPVDRRTDIWSFGCVLFECLTGKRLFQGEDTTDTLATIIKGEPDWAQLPAEMPASIHLLLRKCLAKNPKRRLRDIGDAIVDLEQAIDEPTSSYVRLSDEALSQTQAGSRKWVARAWVAAAVIGWVAAISAWWLRPAPTVTVPSKQLEILIPSKTQFTTQQANNSFALSRDGKRVVYNLSDSGGGLRLRDLETGEDREIPGAKSTDEGHPFMSPNGSRLAMIMADRLVTLPTEGGVPRTILDSDVSWRGFRGGDWSEDGRLVVAQEKMPLRIVSEEGGEASPITSLNNNLAHAFPQFLPGDETILFLSTSLSAKNELMGRAEVVSIESGQRHILDVGDCRYVRYSPSGHLLFVSGNDVFAERFDPRSLKLYGKRTRVLDDVRVSVDWRAQFAVADDGTLVYQAGVNDMNAPRTLVWIDDKGEVSRFTDKEGDWSKFALSPDQTRVALEIESDIWLLERRGDGFETLRPFVAEELREENPCWSADGEFLYYTTFGEGNATIWKKKADFSRTPAQVVYQSDDPKVSNLGVYCSSNDGLIIGRVVDGVFWDILQLRLGTNPIELSPLFVEDYTEIWAAVSPDGRRIAYASNEAEWQVYVAPMDGSSGSQQVSINRGVRPRWSPSGDRLFYVFNNITLFASPLSEQDGRLVLGKPEEVMTWDVNLVDWAWDVANDGKRFIALVRASDELLTEESNGDPVHLKMVTNWFDELNRLVPATE